MIDWITISQDSGSGNAIITVTADTYSGLVERTASLKVSTVSNRITRYVTLIQNAENPFTVTPTIINDNGLGGYYQLEVQSDYGWTATTIPNWVSLSTESGASGMVITATLSMNGGLQNRSAAIEFTDVKGRTATVSLYQAIGELGTPPDNEIWYISTDGNIVEPASGDWGANLTGNTYTTYGVLHFDGAARYIPANAFTNAERLWRIYVPSSLSMVGGSAFYRCANLTVFNSPSNGNLWHLGVNAFSNCRNLSVVSLPDLGPSVIEGCAFESTAISSFVFKESCWFIGYSAFHNCQNLSSVTFYNDYSAGYPMYPNACTDHYFYCADDAFYDVPSGGTIHTPSGVTGIGATGYTGIENWTRANDIDYRTFNDYRIFPYWFRDDWRDYIRVFCFGPDSQTLSVGSGYNSTYGSEINSGTVRQYVLCANYDYNSATTVNVSLSYGSATTNYLRREKPCVTGVTKTTLIANESYRLYFGGKRITNVNPVSKTPSSSRWYAYTWSVDSRYVMVTARVGDSGPTYATFGFVITYDNGATESYSYYFTP